MSDSLTMIRRNLLHLSRYPTLPLSLIGTPLVFLLLFVYVFGATLGNGLGGAGGRAGYLEYVIPGILMMTAAGAAQTTAISVAMDMTEGIIARFRTMAIKRASVLTGHVVGSTLQTVAAMLVVLGVALLLGFRPTAGPLDWLALAGLLLLVTLAMIWLSVALGLTAQSVEVASNLPMPLILLPFLGSGFVPTGTLPVGLRWFAEYQPFTPIIETVRGLLLGTPIGSSAWQAVAWCVAIAAGGYWWARSLYTRNR
ncbi:ABC transporter permease [Dactylosporangium sp. McL0621]|uniref:ABC transporter permease n=1 Tax=Dactylosporangium sp. McL0621 TaxID=3415678 RepID=UPI003CF2373B